MKRHFMFWLLLTIIFSVIVYWPLRDCLPLISQGDIGRELYIYQVTSEGALPYRDYYHTYGPLMPYYYALIFKVWGISAYHVLLGRIFLYITIGVMIFLTLGLFIEPVLAFLAAAWFWTMNIDFGHTFNHAGGEVMIVTLMYLLLKYLRDGRRSWLWGVGACLVALLLIKFNMGLAMVCAAGVSILLIDVYGLRRADWRNFLTLGASLGAVVAVAGMIYGALLLGMPDYYVKQCVPFLPQYDQKPHSSPFLERFAELIDMLYKMYFSPGQSMAPFIVFCALLGLGIVHLVRRRKVIRSGAKIWLAAVVIFIFLIFSAHEFLLSAASYRVLWAFPVMVMLTFFLFGWSAKHLGDKAKVGVLIVLIGIVSGEAWVRYTIRVERYQDPRRALREGSSCVYSRNPLQWTKVVQQVTKYLQSTLPRGETFLALPYDPIYYYLTHRRAPVPEMAFFDFMYIVDVQERRIISDLESKKVNYILVSNRCNSQETGLGQFGKTYCPLLYRYINEHFELVKTFGDWDTTPLWDIADHAVRIYRRR